MRRLLAALGPKMLDAVVGWGDEATVCDRLQQHLDAGADHVCIQALTPGQPFRPDDAALAAFAPGTGTGTGTG